MTSPQTTDAKSRFREMALKLQLEQGPRGYRGDDPRALPSSLRGYRGEDRVPGIDPARTRAKVLRLAAVTPYRSF